MPKVDSQTCTLPWHFINSTTTFLSPNCYVVANFNKQVNFEFS